MAPIHTYQVRYFAAMREQRGLGVESVSSSASTPAELYEDLSRGHGFRLDAHLVRFAVNGDFVSPDHVLAQGDEICLIPPVAGG